MTFVMDGFFVLFFAHTDASVRHALCAGRTQLQALTSYAGALIFSVQL